MTPPPGPARGAARAGRASSGGLREGTLRNSRFRLILSLPAPGSRGATQEESALTQITPAATAATPSTVFAPQRDPGDSQTLLSAILASLEDDKAEDIVTIPLAGKSEIADHIVIASGRSSRQVAAISEKLADRLKADHGVLVRMEGKDLGDWVLVDAGDVIVHVFRPEVREFYQLEKMWQPQAAAPTPRPADTV